MKIIIFLVIAVYVFASFNEAYDEVAQQCLQPFLKWAAQCRCHNPFRRGRGSGRALSCIASNLDAAKAVCGVAYNECDIECPFSFVNPPGNCQMKNELSTTASSFLGVSADAKMKKNTYAQPESKPSQDHSPNTDGRKRNEVINEKKTTATKPDVSKHNGNLTLHNSTASHSSVTSTNKTKDERDSPADLNDVFHTAGDVTGSATTTVSSVRKGIKSNELSHTAAKIPMQIDMFGDKINGAIKSMKMRNVLKWIRKLQQMLDRLGGIHTLVAGVLLHILQTFLNIITIFAKGFFLIRRFVGRTQEA